MKSMLLLILVLVNSSLNGLHASEAEWKNTLDLATRSVVSIRVDAVRAFDTENNASMQATGFVVDAKKGIILTNRHVVQPGPVTAVALFSNSEEVELKPIYRDPIHDFGFYQYDPAKLKFIQPVSLKLRPEHAKIGTEVKVIGNDSGEHMSILSGTLARLDRNPPNYRRGGYNDFNTFYLQSAADTSGGSSGSPVVNNKGEVVALNAGGQFASASSYFLPLFKITRALKAIQDGQQVARGALQTTLRYLPYDEARRLGLSEKSETAFRRKNHGDGVLVVERVVPGGPMANKLRPGDIFLSLRSAKKKKDWITRFEDVEIFLDQHVDASIQVTVERQGKKLEFESKVQNLHQITPDQYLEIGGGILHPFSYQLARQFNLPVAGIYVANPGYMLGNAGISRGSLIKKVGQQDVSNLDQLIAFFKTKKQGERLTLTYLPLGDPRNIRVASVKFDSHWHGVERCKRNDVMGLWQCQQIELSKEKITGATTEIRFSEYKNKKLNGIKKSLVRVEATAPYYVDGFNYPSYSGTGLVVDAERGWVAVDRNTVPLRALDITLTIADAVEIPAKPIYIHPLHNLAILQFDPAQLKGDQLRSAKLDERPLAVDDSVWLTGYNGKNRLQQQQLKVTDISPLRLPRPSVPRFSDSNTEVVELRNPPLVAGGVLLDKRSRVRALWTNYDIGRNNRTLDRGMPVRLLKNVLQKLRHSSSPKIPSLEIAWTPLALASARNLGLPDEWMERYQADSEKPQIFKVLRKYTGSKAALAFNEGDLLLALNDHLIANYAELDAAITKGMNRVTVWRGGKEIELSVQPDLIGEQDIREFYLWNGAILQAPHRALATQRAVELKGAYVSWFWFGSPANRYGLTPTSRVVEMEGETVTNLDDFVRLAQKYRTKTFVRLRLLDLLNQEKLMTIKQQPLYWPMVKVAQSEQGWLYERQ